RPAAPATPSSIASSRPCARCSATTAGSTSISSSASAARGARSPRSPATKSPGLRAPLRGLGQKPNSPPALSPEEKLELQGYISRCYGSLTSFNVLFGADPSQFKGQGDREGW